MRVGYWAGWVAVGLCAAYSAFAFAAAAAAVAGEERAAPPLFVVHAVAGGVALVAGAAQLRLGGPAGPRAGRHRLLGRTYVIAAWVTSAGALGVAASFDVAPAGRAALALGAALWFAATTVAYRRIRAGRAAAHREWAIRSFALAFFFVTFSLWVPLSAATGLPASVAYPAAVVLSWGLNLAVAEAWISRGRRAARAAATLPPRPRPAGRAPARP